MRKYPFIIALYLPFTTQAQYNYRGQVFSAIRQEPITFGTVRLPSPPGTGRYGEQLAKIDSLGYFSFSLKDTSNVWVVVDCMLAGSKSQRIFYRDSMTIISIKTDCYDYNRERAKKDIEKNDIYLLCDLGYAAYKFSDKDSAFEKKYSVKYYSFGDESIWYDCMWLYNKTIAEYLDKKFGEGWRNEVRWDVPFD